MSELSLWVLRSDVKSIKNSALFSQNLASTTLCGLNNLPGAIAGRINLGVAESLAGGFVSIAFKNTFALLIIILVLLIRPEGLLGTEFKERV
jgi:branched-chain amino acid transport system permease protein